MGGRETESGRERASAVDRTGWLVGLCCICALSAINSINEIFCFHSYMTITFFGLQYNFTEQNFLTCEGTLEI